MPFQDIYLKALDEPAIGFAASPKFQVAPFRCPRCNERVWIRVRTNRRTPIGARCEECTWLTTYHVKPQLPAAQKQTTFPR